MSTQTVEKPITEMTSKEVEQYLAGLKKKEAKQLEKEQKEYELGRDTTISSLVARALEIQKYIKDFKEDCAAAMDSQAVKLSEYGKMNKKSKGGFTIKHSNNALAITRRRDTEPTWDERSEKAVELIKEFLLDTVKKRDVKTFTLLLGFLEKNAAGDLEYSRVMDLLKNQDLFDDERWLEGLRLIRQSYSNVLRAFGYEFKQKPVDGDKWESISLNFSSL